MVFVVWTGTILLGCLFKDTVLSSGCIARCSSESIVKDVERTSCAVIWGILPTNLPWRTYEDHDKCIRIAFSRLCSWDLTGAQMSLLVILYQGLRRWRWVSLEILKLTTSVRSFDVDPHRTLVSVFSLAFRQKGSFAFRVCKSPPCNSLTSFLAQTSV